MIKYILLNIGIIIYKDLLKFINYVYKQIIVPSERKSTYYKDVGIDIKEVKKIQEQIGKNIEKTHNFINFGKVISGFGHYAGLIEIEGKIISLHTDGVGTKVLISQLMEKYDTIGIDCIAMNVNDVNMCWIKTSRLLIIYCITKNK